MTSEPSLASASSQPAAFPQQLQLGQGRNDDAFGFPLAGGGLLVILIATAVALRLRAGRLITSATGKGSPVSGRWQSLLGLRSLRTGDPSADNGIVVESQVQVDTATRLQVVRWAGGRLLLATNAQSVMLIDRTGSTAADGEATS